MPDILDFRKEKLCINGLQIGRLTMAGLLAERVPNIARQKLVGYSGISGEHLPAFLDLTLDGFEGNRKVRCDILDSMLAVSVAKTVRSRLCRGRLGLDIVDAMIPVCRRNKKVGEHDMIMEFVCEGPGGLTGLLSVELKLRRLWGTEGDRAKIRAKLRKENCDDVGHGGIR